MTDLTKSGTQDGGRTPSQVAAALKAFDAIYELCEEYDTLGDGTALTPDDLIEIGQKAWDIYCEDQGYRREPNS